MYLSLIIPNSPPLVLILFNNIKHIKHSNNFVFLKTVFQEASGWIYFGFVSVWVLHEEDTKMEFEGQEICWEYCLWKNEGARQQEKARRPSDKNAGWTLEKEEWDGRTKR